MAYNRRRPVWKNYPDVSTPILAEDLNYIEDGLVSAAGVADTALSSAGAAASRAEQAIVVANTASGDVTAAKDAAAASAASAASAANLVGAPASSAIDTYIGSGSSVAVRKGDLVINVSDYASPQAAINAAQALGAPVTVAFPKGSLTTTAALAVTASDITLDMARTRLNVTHAGTAITFTGTSGAPLSRVGIRGGRLELNNTGTSGVIFTYCDGPSVEGVTITNGTTASGGGVVLTNCTDGVVRGVVVDTIGTGVSLSGSVRTSISGCRLRNAQRDGVTAYSQSNDTSVSNVIVDVYNLASESGRAGIHIYGSDRSSVTGCIVNSGSTAGTDDSPKIRFRDGLDFACTGNTVRGIKGGGIGVITLSDIGNGAGKGSITGNTIRDVAVAGIQVLLGGTGTAASLYPVGITGNTILGVRQSGSSAGVGISVAAGADATVIASNYMEDLDGEGIASACKATITGNTIRNIGKGTISSKAAIFVTAGTATVVGNYVFDDQGVPTTTNGLRVFAGAVVRCAGNLFQNATTAVRNDGTLEAQLGEISSGKVGFFGTAPVAKPTGTPAAATDATTTQALVNSLRSSLITLGLIG